MSIGDRVKKLRNQKGLTQSELANLLGYKSKSSVAHIENGRDIPRSMVVKLADVLDSTPAFLMGWTDTPIPEEKPPSSDVREQLDDICDGMTPEMQKELLKYAKYLTMQQSPEIEIVEQTTIGAELDRRAATDAEAKKTAV